MVEVFYVSDFIAVVSLKQARFRVTRSKTKKNKIKRRKSSNHITSLHLYTVYTIRYMKCHVDPNNTQQLSYYYVFFYQIKISNEVNFCKLVSVKFQISTLLLFKHKLSLLKRKTN